jgi:phage shock protein C
MAEQPKRLYRLRRGRKLAGVLGGIADYFGLDPSLVRIAYVFLTFFTLGIPGIVLYLAMAFIVPLEPKGAN